MAARRIVTYYEIITPESIAEGDAEERGEVSDEYLDPDDLDIEEGIFWPEVAVEYLESHAPLEPSDRPHWQPGTWYTEYEHEVDDRTGSVENRTYHLKGFTEDEQREIYNELKRRKLI